MKSQYLRGVLFVALGGICWGFSGTCVQLLTANYGISVSWVISVRLAGAAVIFLVLSSLMPSSRCKLARMCTDKRSVLEILLFSVFGVLCVQVCYVSTISYSNAGTATVFERCGLILIMIISCIMSRRPPRLLEVIGIVLALGGTFCVATKGDFGSLHISHMALLWGCGSAVSLVFYTMLPARLLDMWGSLPVTTGGIVVAAVIANVFVQPWNRVIDITPGVLFGLIALIFFGTIFAYLLFLQGVSDAGPVLAGMVGCVEPISAMSISALWLGTTVTIFDIIGLIMIVLMVILVSICGENHTP